VPPVLSSKDRLIKEPKDFTCCEKVGLRIITIYKLVLVKVPTGLKPTELLSMSLGSTWLGGTLLMEVVKWYNG
jgi:hypothetical protein